MKFTAHCSLLNLIGPASGTLAATHPCRLNILIHKRYPLPLLNLSPQSTVRISNTNPQNPLRQPRDLYRNGPERINSVTHPSSRRSVSVSGSSNTAQPRLTVILHPHNSQICQFGQFSMERSQAEVYLSTGQCSDRLLFGPAVLTSHFVCA